MMKSLDHIVRCFWWAFLLFFIFFVGSFANADDDTCISPEDFLKNLEISSKKPPCDAYVGLQIAYFGKLGEKSLTKFQKPVLIYIKNNHEHEYDLIKSVYRTLLNSRHIKYFQGFTAMNRIYFNIGPIENKRNSYRREVLYWRIAFRYNQMLFAEMGQQDALFQLELYETFAVNFRNLRFGYKFSMKQLECLFVLFHPSVKFSQFSESPHINTCLNKVDD